jgi:(S)-2-hydroxyglutarate dehydrogenase
MSDRSFDLVIIGGGIVGLAVGRELLRRNPGRQVAVAEKEERVAHHQSGHNSGVIHSGVYYKPHSAKARLCVEGRAELLRFCEQNEIPYALRGKLILAVKEAELPLLDELHRRGQANRVQGIELIGPDQIAEREPYARGLRALAVPTAGVVDYRAVCAAIAKEIQETGGQILLGHRVTGIVKRPAERILQTTRGVLRTRRVVACGGLQCDRLAAMSSAPQEFRIVPFRGDFYTLRPAAAELVRSMIYPVPDPRFPFLGVHFTRRIDGEVWAGPNAVLALDREAYKRFGFRIEDEWSTLTWPGFWRLARKYWRSGAAELWRDWVKSSYLRQLQRYVPEVQGADLLPGPCGIRAQAVARDGRLVDDFAFSEADGVLHVLNAPSPAATAAFAIAKEIVDRLDNP